MPQKNCEKGAGPLYLLQVEEYKKVKQEQCIFHIRNNMG